jgi:hypothetical protein
VGDAIFNKGGTPAGLNAYFSNVQDPIYVANVFLYVTHELIGDAIMVIPMFEIFLLVDTLFCRSIDSITSMASCFGFVWLLLSRPLECSVGFHI